VTVTVVVSVNVIRTILLMSKVPFELKPSHEIADFAVVTADIVPVLDTDPSEIPTVPSWIDLITLAVRDANGCCDHICAGLSCRLIR
jgi:hypothetical protein